MDYAAVLAAMSPADRAAIKKRAQTFATNPRAARDAREEVVDLSSPVEVRKARKMRDNFRAFVEEFWSVVEPSMRFLPAPHIDAICDHLQAVGEGRVKRLLINVPPGHAKSIIVAVLWPAWMWLRQPGWRVLVGSYALDLAERDSQRSREVLTSDKYLSTKAHLGLTWRLSADQNQKAHFGNSEKGFRMALSVGSKATGFRGDCLIFDDLVNVKDPAKITRESLSAATTWWKVTMSSRLNDLRVGVKIGIMQRVSEFDPCDDLIRSRRPDGGFEYDLLALPSEYDPDLYRALGREGATTSIGWKDWRTNAGDLLFPALFGANELAQAKQDLGTLAYAAQHGQRPAPQSGGFFHRSWWRFWVPDGVEMPPSVIVDTPRGPFECPQVRLPPLTARTISCDFTFKDKITSDYVAIQVWGRGAIDGFMQGRFLLDQVHRRYDFVASVGALRDILSRHPLATTVLVEDAANGPAIMSALRDEVAGLVPVQPLGGKEARANAISPIVESGCVYLPHPAIAPWVADFLTEVSGFPKAKHDDQVDAMTQYLARKRVIVL